jgi:hypothetical protein
MQLLNHHQRKDEYMECTHQDRYQDLIVHHNHQLCYFQQDFNPYQVLFPIFSMYTSMHANYVLYIYLKFHSYFLLQQLLL